VRAQVDAVHRNARTSLQGRAAFREHREPWEVTRDLLLAEAQRRGIEPDEGESASALAERVRNAQPPEEPRP
jgi:hypothetical protein